MKNKSSPRLKCFDYKGFYAYFITICTRNMETIFFNKDIALMIIQELNKISKNRDFMLVAYCLMPDHIHFIIKGENKNSDLKNFIKLFKQKTSYCFKQQTSKILWHLSYYDHIVRENEDMKDIIYYIFNNPVRKGIIDEWDKYLYSGPLKMIKNIKNAYSIM